MKVFSFMLSLNPKYGGPTFSVPIQCRGLAHEGVDISLFTYSESQPFEKDILKDGVKVVEYDKPQSFIRKKWHLALKNILKESADADIYHYHGIWLPCNHWVAKYARKHGRKAVVNPRGDLEIARINYNRWKKLKKQIVWWLYGKKDTQNAACIIATSEQEMAAVRSLGITAPVAIIPNGIETSSFPKSITHNHHDKKTILFLSRVNPIKGIEYLLDAWKSIPTKEREGWQIHIAGNSDPKDYVRELEKRTKELGLCNSVSFIGPINGDDKIRKYQESDIFVLPTLNENFGNVVAEAMMCELPVITTTNAPWSIINDYQCGWWIELSVENLVNALSDAMKISDQERWEKGKRGKICIEENFASAAVAKKTVSLYKWVLGESDKPDYVYL